VGAVEAHQRAGIAGGLVIEAGDEEPAVAIERQAAGEVVARLRAGVVGVELVLAPDIVGKVAHEEVAAVRAVAVAVRAEREAEQADEPEARGRRLGLRDEHAVRAGRDVEPQHLARQAGELARHAALGRDVQPPSGPKTSELGPFSPPGWPSPWANTSTNAPVRALNRKISSVMKLAT
jgi:hypothetical protein